MKNLFLKSTLLYALLSLIALSTIAQDTLNVMFYNVYRFPSANPTQREVLLSSILRENHPDMLLICELESEDGADRILNHSFTNSQDQYGRAAFVFNQSAVDDTLQQMLYYNKRKFTLIDQQVYPTYIRDINRYTLLLNTTDVATDSVIFEVFVTHLKSSTGTANVNARFAMLDTMVNVLATIPTDRHVILGGDMNFYTSFELGYQHIIDTNRMHVLVDPVGPSEGKWQDEEDFQALHTQSTRISAAGFGLYGATGGMDDRFDFLFLSKHLQTENANADVRFVAGSYQAIGNNGNCLNKAIKDTSCTGVYSQQLRQYLHDMSDHTPVALQLFTNKTIGPGAGTSIAPHLAQENASLSILGANQVQHLLYVKWDVAPIGYKAQSIRVINQIGQVVYEQSLPKQSDILHVDVSNLPAGMYYIGTGNGNFSKFIKY